MCVAGDNIVPIDVLSTDSIRRECNMNWIGKWKNQYGSILEISDDSDNRIVGTFRTALEDSRFFGQEVAFVGLHAGACISVSDIINQKLRQLNPDLVSLQEVIDVPAQNKLET